MTFDTTPHAYMINRLSNTGILILALTGFLGSTQNIPGKCPIIALFPGCLWRCPGMSDEAWRSAAKEGDMMGRMSINQVETPTTIAMVKATLPGFTVEQAFDAWTQPEKLTAWWPQRVALLPNADLAVGAAYVLEWPFMNWTLRGTYLAWERPWLLAFTWKWDHEPDLPMRTVVIRFTQRPENIVDIVIVHGVYSEAAREREDRQSHLDGWIYFMEKLAGTVASDGAIA